MTPTQFVKMRRLEIMRRRLTKSADPNIAEMRAYRLLTEEHLFHMQQLARRQADALEGIATALSESRHARPR